MFTPGTPRKVFPPGTWRSTGRYIRPHQGKDRRGCLHLHRGFPVFERGATHRGRSLAQAGDGFHQPGVDHRHPRQDSPKDSRTRILNLRVGKGFSPERQRGHFRQLHGGYRILSTTRSWRPGAKPEFEIFDFGWLGVAKYLVKTKGNYP